MVFEANETRLTLQPWAERHEEEQGVAGHAAEWRHDKANIGQTKAPCLAAVGVADRHDQEQSVEHVVLVAADGAGGELGVALWGGGGGGRCGRGTWGCPEG